MGCREGFDKTEEALPLFHVRYPMSSEWVKKREKKKGLP
jgi:hypothetical protein